MTCEVCRQNQLQATSPMHKKQQNNQTLSLAFRTSDAHANQTAVLVDLLSNYLAALLTARKITQTLKTLIETASRIQVL